MSQENAELVRAWTESYGIGDREALDFMSEDVGIRLEVSRFPEEQRCCGREEFRRFIADIDQGFEGGGTAVSGRPSRWATGSWLGSTGDARVGVTRFVAYIDHERALEAVGLRE